ncbi:MAG: hypothetical protein GY835_24950 [bacterium]|nr:hypothetical protein [bacterium]
MTQRPTQPSHLKISGFMIALLLSGITALQVDADTITIDQGGSRTEIKIDFSKECKEDTVLSTRRITDINPVTVSSDFEARVLISWGDGRECAWVVAEDASIELDRKSLQCDNVESRQCDNACKPEGIGYMSVEKDETPFRVAVLEHRKLAINAGDDLGIALNIIQRSGSTDGARYFSGASFYASLTNLRSKKFRLIGVLSALDFREDVDFEAGLGIGLLYKPSKRQPNFSVAASYGYNFMVADGEEPWFTMIGFGWNFGKNDSPK